MENITLELLLYLAAGAALGGYVNGLAGFGTGLMSLGIWLQVMSVEEAVPVVAAMSVVSGVQVFGSHDKVSGRGCIVCPAFWFPH